MSIAEQTPIYAQMVHDYPDVWYRFWVDFDDFADLLLPTLNPFFRAVYDRLYEAKERQAYDRLHAKFSGGR